MPRDLVCIPKPVRAHLSDGVNDYRMLLYPLYGARMEARSMYCNIVMCDPIIHFYIIMSGCEPVHNERPTGMRAMLGLWKTICLL